MSDRRVVRFTPSVYTRYDSISSNYGQTESAAESADSSFDINKIIGTVGSAIPLVSQFIGGSKSERESVAEIEAKIKVAEYNKLHPTLWTSFKNWDKELIMLRAQLEAAKSLAADEEAAADAAKWRDVGYTVLVFGGVLVVLGVAANQFAQAKKTVSSSKKSKLDEEEA